MRAESNGRFPKLESNQRGTMIKRHEINHRNDRWLTVGEEPLYYAMFLLSGNAFKLWCYLCNNQDGYCFGFSSAHFTFDEKMCVRATTAKSWNELVEHGFLFDYKFMPENLQGYIFVEYPPDIMPELRILYDELTNKATGKKRADELRKQIIEKSKNMKNIYDNKIIGDNNFIADNKTSATIILSEHDNNFIDERQKFYRTPIKKQPRNNINSIDNKNKINSDCIKNDTSMYQKCDNKTLDCITDETILSQERLQNIDIIDNIIDNKINKTDCFMDKIITDIRQCNEEYKDNVTFSEMCSSFPLPKEIYLLPLIQQKEVAQHLWETFPRRNLEDDRYLKYIKNIYKKYFN